MYILNKKNIKDLFDKATDQRYHQIHKRSALKALNIIEAEQGSISKKLKNQCDAYAKDYLGSIQFAPWLYVYSAIQREFKEGWIPDNYYGKYIANGIDSSFGKVSSLKPLTNTLLRTDKLPDLLYINNGLFLKPETFEVISESEAINILFESNSSVIFKSNSSEQGIGVAFFNQETFNIAYVKKQTGVFQKVIRQHEFFNRIFPHPGATIRITTALDSKGKSRTRSAYLRLGRSNQPKKSIHVQASTLVKTAIDIDSGELYTRGYMPDWSSTLSHPDTGVSFEGLVIPAFEKACSVVEQLHNNYPFVQCIGWDVSINDKEEIEIMEWNGLHNDIKFSEAVHGPCFKDLLERSLAYRKQFF